MKERMFCTRDELAVLSDLTLIENRKRYQRLRAMLEGEESSGGKEHCENIERVLREIQAELRARGYTEAGQNRS